MDMTQYLKRTPSGLVLRNYIRRLTPDLFTWENAHNPVVARHCSKCDGKGFYRIGEGIARRDETCTDCGGVGGFEEELPFFASTATAHALTVGATGNAECPSCRKLFPVTSNQFWSGLRHSCGQKLLLKGPHRELCWRRGYDSARGIDTDAHLTAHESRPFWKRWG